MTTPDLHDHAYVADLIGKSEYWVRRRTARLPHHRFGRTAKFTDEDVAEIVSMHAKAPSAAASVPVVGNLRPSPRSRQRRTA